MQRALLTILLVFLGACGGTVVLGEGASSGGGSGGGTGLGGGTGGGNVVSADGGFTGLPCDVATVLANDCVSCHGPVLSGAAPFPLYTRDQLLEAAPGFPQTKAQRSLIRMQAGTMPPFPAAPVSAADIATFKAWVTGGTPLGSCGSVSVPDAGPAPVICTSGAFWNTGFDEGSNMDPGLACVACHAQQSSSKAYFFMGTVFPTAHEQDLCEAIPKGKPQVEIFDRTDAGVLTLTVFTPSGNFYSTNTAAIGSNGKNIALPYRARVLMPDGGYSEMKTPQMDGDCNTCHTEQGLQGAPGRIVWP